jgi:tetratricopeptide (TPR) repeat protein
LAKLIKRASRHFEKGEDDQVWKLCRQVLAKIPDQPDALHLLAVVALRQKDAETAHALLSKALWVRLAFPLALFSLGFLMMRLRENEQAAKLFELALKYQPEFTQANINLGKTYVQLGRYRAAASAYQNALKQDPGSIEALCGLVRTRKIKPGDPELKQFIAASEHAEELSFSRQVQFFFAWGKALDDIGDYHNAFLCFDRANQLRRAERPYDAKGQEEKFAALQAFFFRLERHEPPPGASDSQRPLFVVGMPRSGTTLTEQIMAGHSQVYGAGELAVLGDACRQAVKGDGTRHFYHSLRQLGPAVLEEVAQTYLQALGSLDTDAARVVDKMPANFWYVGIIRLVLPRARIIHVVRNPVDTLLSCFQQNFSQGQEFSNDLASAAHYYRLYRDIMDFWQQWDTKAFLTVRYEDLTADLESQARRIVDHIGLEWEADCALPHKAKRSVKTASVWQVRQPVYQTSVARWKRYETELQSLLEKLDEYGVNW